MTDTQIIHTLKERGECPTIPRIISEFHCGYQMALRIQQTLTDPLVRKAAQLFNCESVELIDHEAKPKPATEIDLFE